MSDSEDVRILRQELRGLFDRIQKIRHEIASIRKPGDDHDRFASMSDELDAIVDATETATNTIMENAETIDDLMRTARPAVADEEAVKALDRVPDHIGAIFEACSFQDITGQRITKVVKTLQYIEQRVNALIHVWGEAELSGEPGRSELDELPADDERRLLNGPQLAGEGVSQSDVDAILNGAEPAGTDQEKAQKRRAVAERRAAASGADTDAKRKADPDRDSKGGDEAPPKMDQTDIDSMFD
ncbi:protein phosphatase CheZ [Roseospira navarrensis]|uniref:Chemotaxis protein CheZ n=1 Tax=Roseospira navarrensis TaxID=140058 RepID=A0A7X1ZBD9_9PROT|nr:protein phosphatase CheZ [Roseospira navarrensis]MQX35426.1 hypothetical protein [Roseospira navarrensis]